MGQYIDAANIPPVTFTSRERDRLLKTTGKHKAGLRDHVMYSLGFATALRLSELVALNVGDISHGKTPKGEWSVKQVLQLRVYKGMKPEQRPKVPQEVPISDAARAKLGLLLKWKEQHGESIAPDAPLFCAKGGKRRVSARAAQERLCYWQREAGLERRHNFHRIRHTALTEADRQSAHNMALVKRLGRHVKLSTTARYVHASDEEVRVVANRLPC